MIIQCAQCRTRFRIPDEKVGERGAKVRCTRCQHTFRVMRESSEPQEASLPPEAPPPPPASPPPLANLFEDPLPEPPTPSPDLAVPQVSPEGAVPLARIALVKRTVEVPAVEPPLPARLGLGAWLLNLAVGAFVLLVLSTAAVVYLEDGNLDRSSFQRLRAMFAPPRELLAVDISNGLYDTQAGKPVLFVRGEVLNRSGRPGRAKLRAEILEGGQLVRAAETVAGVMPNPEELYLLSSAAEVEALNAGRGRAAPTIEPGGRQPFLLAFYEYPPNLQGFRLKVSVSEVRGEAATR